MALRSLKGKKGDANEQVLWVLGEMLFVVTFGVAVFTWLSSLEKDTTLEKNYLARDLSLVVGAAYSSPGGLEYEYAQTLVNLSDYNFFFKSQILSVSEKADKKKGSLYYWYADNKISKSFLDKELDGPATIKVCNSGGEVVVGEEECLSVVLPKCPEAETKLDRKPVIMLDPVFGGAETGKTSPDGTAKEAEIARKIALSLQNYDVAGHFTIIPTRDLNFDLADDQTMTIDDRKELLSRTSYDVLVKISIGEYSDDRTAVKVWVPDFAIRNMLNEKMGCNIGNMLLQNVPDIASASPPIEKIDPLLNLKEEPGVVAIELELGNINSPDAELLSAPGKTAKAIYDALKFYYGID
ncbi:MAG: hypothetical protein QS98_C0006G0025 [archaeon GW2011_AR3]|nr:MAG: hypothetical protein QS98_C0006G0025 [archaeon GW2011_AR3]MBS3109214.1 N-acetylmuramoyl-L-alanine amidase [Candidatus Woesearchaeota archaeon]